jgi:predicted HD phosphohydrolase
MHMPWALFIALHSKSGWLCALSVSMSNDMSMASLMLDQLSGGNLKQEHAIQALMQPSRQSVEEVKRVVAEARHKVQRPPTNINGTFNEEDFMDGDLVDEDMA